MDHAAGREDEEEKEQEVEDLADRFSVLNVSSVTYINVIWEKYIQPVIFQLSSPNYSTKWFSIIVGVK